VPARHDLGRAKWSIFGNAGRVVFSFRHLEGDDIPRLAD
jgi:hypothetical protein